MAIWDGFARLQPVMASFGRERLEAGVAWLATVRSDGGPRVHPVSPKLAEGQLVVYMYPSSPKAHDLRRDPRFCLHATVENDAGGGGEFSVTGTASVIEDAPMRAAIMGGAERAAPYVLFALDIASALAITYRDGQPVRLRWP